MGHALITESYLKPIRQCILHHRRHIKTDKPFRPESIGLFHEIINLHVDFPVEKMHTI